jgi:proteasome lid subunit RPN8/RPN11
MSVAVEIPAELAAAMAAHAEASYPSEGCGVLVGRARDGARIVVDFRPAPNSLAPARRDRYRIEPEQVLFAEREARRRGLDIVGFYHSHPDHPAVPSDFDREQAWPWYVYVIVPVTAGRAGRARAWLLREDRSGFEEIELCRSGEVSCPSAS